MKVREVMRLLTDDGWVLARQSGSHRQFKHPTKRGLVCALAEFELDRPGAGRCMHTSCRVSPFAWNAGWSGALLGSTIWLLVLGVAVFSEDMVAGALALAGFAAGNLWGIALWRRRHRLSAYSGLQWLMLGLLVVFAAVVSITNARVPSGVPYWAIAVPLLPMAMFWLREQAARRANTS